MRNLIDSQIIDEADQTISLISPSTVSGRRRPGRLETVNPALIPLLHGETIAEISSDFSVQHDLAPAKGIAMGLLLSIPPWGMLGFAASLVL